MATTEKRHYVYQRIYVWQTPVRVFHWLNALCVFVLIITGLLIGSPIAIEYSTEAYQQYWFGTVRFIHFIAAYVFMLNSITRLYWGFVGNRYARWKRFIPYRRENWKEMWAIFRADVMQTHLHGDVSIGHNMLAGTIYFITMIIMAFQVISGFAIYAAMSNSSFPQLFAWVTPILGGDFGLRMIHHALTWFYVSFTIIHVYLVFYHDYVEGRGIMSSMVGGWKFERKRFLDATNDK